jgi:hypothetical protein
LVEVLILVGGVWAASAVVQQHWWLLLGWQVAHHRGSMCYAAADSTSGCLRATH